MDLIEIEMYGESAFYVKGHVSITKMIEELEAIGADGFFEKDNIPVHTRARKTPDPSGNYGYLIKFDDNAGKGSFPVTAILP